MSRIEGSVVITGASTGLGKACAAHLARLGLTVFAGVRRPSDAEALRAEIPNVNPITLDVRSADDVRACAARFESKGVAPLLGIVNNAGISVPAPLELVELSTFVDHFETNVVGALRLVQALLPALRASSGRIVNVGSALGRVAVPFQGSYCASKFALEGLTDCLRRELDGQGVGVSIVEPGAIVTPIWAKMANSAARVLEQAAPERARFYQGSFHAQLAENAALSGRRGTPPEAVARAVEHALLSKRPRARYPVGTDARMVTWAVRLVPDRWLDKVLIPATQRVNT